MLARLPKTHKITIRYDKAAAAGPASSFEAERSCGKQFAGGRGGAKGMVGLGGAVFA